MQQITEAYACHSVSKIGFLHTFVALTSPGLCGCRVALSDLLAATSVCAKRYFLNAHVHTTGNRRQPVVHGPRSMQLHPCFANSLRLAQVRNRSALVQLAQSTRCVQIC